MGINIREARTFVGLLILSAAYFTLFTGTVLSDQLDGSDAVDLGMGPRPIYRIGYSGNGSPDIDELIELAHKNPSEEQNHENETDLFGVEPSNFADLGQDAPVAKEPDLASEFPAKDVPEGEIGPAEGKVVEKPDYIRVPVLSDPPGAEVYIDGTFYGFTPLIATVEPDSHLVEIYMEGHWNWFNIVDFSGDSRTVRAVLVPLPKKGSLATNASAVAEPAPLEENETENVTTVAISGGDFWDENYTKLLMLVALLSFLIGSGSIATYARSRLVTSVKINFPRDGEDKWAGLIEGQSNRVYGTKKGIYVLVRYDDDKLQVRKQVVPNRDGRWSTRCEVEEGTVYRIYAVVTDKPLPEKIYLGEFPTYRDISEIGPVTGRGKRGAD